MAYSLESQKTKTYSRVKANLIVSLERRIGRSLTMEELPQLDEVTRRIEDLAKRSRLSQTQDSNKDHLPWADQNVDHALFVEVCLNQMRVEDKNLLPNALEATKKLDEPPTKKHVSNVDLMGQLERDNVAGYKDHSPAAAELDKRIAAVINGVFESGADDIAYDKLTQLFTDMLSYPDPTDPNALVAVNSFKAERFASLFSDERIIKDPTKVLSKLQTDEFLSAIYDLLYPYEDRQQSILVKYTPLQLAQKAILRDRIVGALLYFTSKIDYKKFGSEVDEFFPATDISGAFDDLLDRQIWKLPVTDTGEGHSLQELAYHTNENIAKIYSRFGIEDAQDLDFKETREALYSMHNFHPKDITITDYDTLNNMHLMAVQAQRNTLSTERQKAGYDVIGAIFDCAYPEDLKRLAEFCRQYVPFWKLLNETVPFNLTWASINAHFDRIDEKLGSGKHSFKNYPVVTLINPQALPVARADLKGVTVRQADPNKILDASAVEQMGLTGLPENLKWLIAGGKINVAISTQSLEEEIKEDDKASLFDEMVWAMKDNETDQLDKLKINAAGFLTKSLPYTVYKLAERIEPTPENIHVVDDSTFYAETE